MDETVRYARRLARRLGEEIGLAVYCYENAAFSEQRRNLAVLRAGEYEGLKAKLSRPEWKPDFGPSEFNPKSGATAVGARDVLVAYNVNLNTTSLRRADAIAGDVREKGRIQREGNPLTGKIVRNAEGQPVLHPRHPEMRQGHGLVYRGIRHRSGVDEFDECRRDAGARRLRRGLAPGPGPRCEGNGLGDASAWFP